MSSATNDSNNNQLDLTPIQLPRTRITKATTSTTAVQPLEITTTAVVNCSNEEDQQQQQEQEENDDRTLTKHSQLSMDLLNSGNNNNNNNGNGNSEDRSGESDQPVQQRRNETRRKQSHHHHRHRIKSPVFQPDGSVSPLGSPMSSAGGGSTVVTPSINHDNVIFSELPPPIIKEGPSEAIVALQDAVNESNATASSSTGTITPPSTTSSIVSPTAILSSVTSSGTTINATVTATTNSIISDNKNLLNRQHSNHRQGSGRHHSHHQSGGKNNHNHKKSSSNNKNATTTSTTTIPEETKETIDQLFESCFFSAVLLLQWSNVMGPKMEKVWSSSDEETATDEKLQTLIGRQVLNGEMGRSIMGVELKWITLHRQGILCASFLYNDKVSSSINSSNNNSNNGSNSTGSHSGISTSSALCALVFILPLRYLRNFSPYFHVLRDRVSPWLIEPLQLLRKLSRRRHIPWSTALDFFAYRCLAPFIRSIMKIESVSLPLECNKICYNLFDQESKQLFDPPFFGRVVTSHLQTFASSVLVGNSLTTMNMMINTLSLFLSPEERNRSSHARKNLKYMADLYLQGLLIQDMENIQFKLDMAVLDSNIPTTIVDMSKLTVKQTPLFPQYRKLQKDYRNWVKVQLEDDLIKYLQPPSERSTSSGITYPEWKKQPSVFHKMDSIAPMIKSLLDEIRIIPTRLREAYVRQWRRWLVRRAIAFIQFSKNEGFGNIDKLKNALQLHDHNDFLIVLAQAEKLKPGLIEKLHIYSH
ncbi:hypothetical protein INT45_006642 [Circinella minor]|uniref:Uncharacterized protein n=1 Tax=Circinella minor TaxID=1195481 RepID=A0A8H7SCX7_9FUNG|nr:hypothetical protein INT45_006642 [Circinella minor]